MKYKGDGMTQRTTNNQEKNRTGRSKNGNNANKRNAIFKSADSGLKLVIYLFQQEQLQPHPNMQNNNKGVSMIGQGGVERVLTLASSQMSSIINIIDTLQEKEDLLSEDKDSESWRIKKRLKISQMALESAYKDLDTASN